MFRIYYSYSIHSRKSINIREIVERTYDVEESQLDEAIESLSNLRDFSCVVLKIAELA